MPYRPCTSLPGSDLLSECAPVLGLMFPLCLLGSRLLDGNRYRREADDGCACPLAAREPFPDEISGRDTEDRDEWQEGPCYGCGYLA